MNKLKFVIFILFSQICSSQIPLKFPVIDNSNLPEATFKPARHFTGESLFGYINGGAELYREFGMSDAVITELDYKSGHIKCEVYKMTGPEEAFGIFSVSRYKCPGTPAIGAFCCQTRYQLQFCKGPYYISIINSGGNRADSLISVKIGNIISDQITELSADLLSFLPGLDPIDFRQNTVLVMGRLGLMNGATRWEDYFKDVSGYTALIITESKKTLLSVRFRKPDDFRQFIGLHGWGTCDLSINGLKMTGGEVIKLLADTHLLIEIGN